MISCSKTIQQKANIITLANDEGKKGCNHTPSPVIDAAPGVARRTGRDDFGGFIVSGFRKRNLFYG